MNYIIEGNVDFFTELAKDEEQDDTNVCLLSGTTLARNHISLSCDHKFNYCPLFQEVVKQKTVYNPNDTSRLMLNEIKCPYCRQITSHILPYIPSEKGISKIKGVNHPKILCLQHKECSWHFKTGKKRGMPCGDAGFDTDHGTYCTKHWVKAGLKASKNNATLQGMSEAWTTEMEDMFCNHTVASLKELLRNNKLKVSGSKKELVCRAVLI
jgi:hypothetical protein